MYPSVIGYVAPFNTLLEMRPMSDSLTLMVLDYMLSILY